MKEEFKEKYRLLGVRIAYFRKKKGLTQEQLAELTDINSTFLGQIERGVRGVSLDNIFKLSQVLETPEHKLFLFED